MGPPAFAIGEDVALAAGPVENFGGETAHGLPSDPCRVSASAPERAEHDDSQADDHRHRDDDDRPREPVAGALDPEQHGGAEKKRGNAAKAENHGRVEG